MCGSRTNPLCVRHGTKTVLARKEIKDTFGIYISTVCMFTRMSDKVYIHTYVNNFRVAHPFSSDHSGRHTGSG